MADQGKRVYGRQFNAMVHGTDHVDLIQQAEAQARDFFAQDFSGLDVQLETYSSYSVSPSIRNPGQYTANILIREVLSKEPSPADPSPMEERVKRAMHYASEFGYIDGGHHKQWVIDQMVRALTGCPMVEKTAEGVDGPYTYEVQGESDEYREWAGGPGERDEGIAP
jgi:hypothetical protein